MTTELTAVLPRLLKTAHKGRTHDRRVFFEAAGLRDAAEALGIELCGVSTKEITLALKEIGAERVTNGMRGARYAMKQVALERVTEQLETSTSES